MSAPMQPSTCSHRSSCATNAAKALRSSISTGIDGAGRCDPRGREEARRAIWRSLCAGRQDRCAVRRCPSERAAKPGYLIRASIAAMTRAMKLVEPWNRSGFSGRCDAAFAARRPPALTLRPTVRPMILAIEPPLTSVPLADRKTNHVFEPADHLLVHQGRCVIAAAKVGAPGWRRGNRPKLRAKLLDPIYQDQKRCTLPGNRASRFQRPAIDVAGEAGSRGSGR